MFVSIYVLITFLHVSNVKFWQNCERNHKIDEWTNKSIYVNIYYLLIRNDTDY